MADRILVVDDDEELAELLGLLFTKKGFETQTALNGKDALDKLDDFRPAVVVQDYMLPDMKGVDLLREIRLSSPESYVVIITARGNEDVAVELLKAGASDYVRKPFDTEKLVSTVENILRLRSAESERYKLICELQRQNKELLAINALSSALTSSMNRSVKCGSAVDIIMNSMRADITNVFLNMPGNSSLMLQASHSVKGEILIESDFSGKKGLAYYIREIRKPAVVADISQEKRINIPDRVRSLGMMSALGVPMMHKDDLTGVLEVYYKKPRGFQAFDIKLLSSFANLLAMTLENEAMSAGVGRMEKKWQATCDAIPEMIVVQDNAHRIVNANKTAADVAGTSVEDLIGQQCCWMFHNTKQPIKDCPVDEVFRTKQTVEKELLLEDGKKLHVRAVPVFGTDGEIEFVVEHARSLES